MRTQYLTNPDFTYEKVNRASVACGPMVKWAIAQLGYADMIRRVEPLRNEMRSLEKSAEVAKVKSEQVDKVTVQHALVSLSSFLYSFLIFILMFWIVLPFSSLARLSKTMFWCIVFLGIIFCVT